MISAVDAAAVVELVESGSLNDRLARQVVEGVIAGEGTPAEVVAARGLKVVLDDGGLIAALMRRWPSSPTCSRRSARAKCRLPEP